MGWGGEGGRDGSKAKASLTPPERAAEEAAMAMVAAARPEEEDA